MHLIYLFSTVYQSILYYNTYLSSKQIEKGVVIKIILPSIGNECPQSYDVSHKQGELWLFIKVLNRNSIFILINVFMDKSKNIYQVSDNYKKAIGKKITTR